MNAFSSVTEKLTNTISSLVSKLTGGAGPPGEGPGGGALNNSFSHMNLDDSLINTVGGTRSGIGNLGTGMPRSKI